MDSQRTFVRSYCLYNLRVGKHSNTWLVPILRLINFRLKEDDYLNRTLLCKQCSFITQIKLIFSRYGEYKEYMPLLWIDFCGLLSIKPESLGISEISRDVQKSGIQVEL